MIDGYPIPAGTQRCELLVSNSRFIADARPARDVVQARAVIAAIRAELPDANHHCYAYLIGYGASVQAGMSDDGEPSGTAGRPMMAVLRGGDIGDVVVVVTRYFGGTLLGTGGLVRAYGDAVRQVLLQLPRDVRLARQRVTVGIGYAEDGAVRRALAAVGATIVTEVYAADVQLTFDVLESRAEPLLAQLRDITSARMTMLERTAML